MTYLDPQAKTVQASRLKMEEVANLGQSLGHWTIVKTSPYNDDPWRFVTIETPQGARFSMSGGAWNKAGMIAASLDTITGAQGHKVSPRDVIAYREPAAPEAAASHTRPAAAIVADLVRRVIANPAALEIARKQRERLANLEGQGVKLRAHVAKLAALGFTFREMKADESYSATAYAPSGSNLHKVTVYESGRVTFDSACDVSKLADIMAACRDVAAE